MAGPVGTPALVGPAPAAPVRAPAARPWLPWLAFAFVVGAMAPGALPAATGVGDGLAWWWGLGLPLALLALLCAPRMALAARWSAAAAALVLGSALVAPAPAPDGVTRLYAVTGTVMSVKWPREAGARTVPAASAAPVPATRATAAPAREPGPSQGVLVAVEKVELPMGMAPPRRLFVRVREALPGLRVGDVIAAEGLWSRDQRGEELDAIAATRVRAREDGARGWAWRALGRVQTRRELAEAYVLGWGDPPETGEFRRAGLLHVLAVSGMHLVIAGAMAMWLLRVAGVGWGARQVAVVALMCGYAWLTGMSPATVRALAMIVAGAIMQFGGREPHRLATVALAALALVAVDPGYAGDIGFQLSLAAVLGIATMGRDLARLRARYIPLEAWPLDRPSWRGMLWCAREVLDSLAIGIGATVATLPVIAWDFQVAYPWSALTTIAISVPSTLALWLGLPLMGLAGMWPGGPWDGLYLLLEGCLDLLARMVAGSGRLPGGMVACGVPSVWCVLLWPLLFLPLRDRRDLWRRAAAFGLLLLLW
jgi:ComEC/Rec2-related protein